MFRFIAHRIAAWAFGNLSERDIEPLLARCSPDIEHTFAGDHALSGTRRSVQTFRAWLERLYRPFPELDFDLPEVMVAGPPWDMRVAVTWSDRGVAADGRDYRNEGVHILRLVWGRLTELDAKLDTQALNRTLQRMRAEGIEEAGADPVEGR